MLDMMACLASIRAGADSIHACATQVSVDVPRTAPNVSFFHEPIIQKSLERLLYIWGIRCGGRRGGGGLGSLVLKLLLP